MEYILFYDMQDMHENESLTTILHLYTLNTEIYIISVLSLMADDAVFGHIDLS